MPITSDGKAPDLRPFLKVIAATVGKAVRRAHRPNTAGSKPSKISVVLDNHTVWHRNGCGTGLP
jgi:hypothetical protein